MRNIKKMFAAVLHKPGDIRYEEVDIPEIGKRDVLIKIKAAGNCGSDLQRVMVEGTYSFPCIPGHEFSGEIVEIGENVNELKIGDRVTAAPLIQCMKCRWCLQGHYNLCEDYDYVGSRSDGAFAEYMKIPAFNVVKIPDSLDFEDAAVTDPLAVALHAINRSGGIKAGDSVAVLGAGPIGMLACQWAKLLGASIVIASDIVRRKLEILKETGIDHTIDVSKEDVVEKVMQLTENQGVDLVIESAGSIETHKQALMIAKKRGSIVHIGRAHRDMTFPDDVFTKTFRRELNIYGAVNSNFSPNDHEWKTCVDFLANGKVMIKPLISHRLPFSKIPETFNKMYKKEIFYNKIIFSPDN